MTVPKFVLASASPARRLLLLSVGIEPVVRKSDFDESQIQLADPAELVQVLAHHKANTVANQLPEPALVLGCDSVLALAKEVYGKPADAAEATTRWQQMRGRMGKLYTGHALVDLYRNKTLIRHQITQVYFADISDRQIAAYVATGEPLQCAGCFALDGKGGLFIDKIEGCHSNVIGLSLPLLRQMLAEVGYDATDFWQTSTTKPAQ